MSDIRLVNVIPVVNGWKAASLKSKGEAQTLMASGNIPDYNAGLVKNAAADLVAGMAEDLLKAPVIDPETLRPPPHYSPGGMPHAAGASRTPPLCHAFYATFRLQIPTMWYTERKTLGGFHP